MKRKLPKAKDESERRVLRDVAESGCHIVGVLAGKNNPAFAYSIGLFHNYEHPEILICGLDHRLMQTLINDLCARIEQGSCFPAGARTSELIANLDCEFRPVDLTHYRELFGYARWFYQGDAFPAVQCVWPDPQGLFPGAPGFDAKFIPVQPTFEAARSR